MSTSPTVRREAAEAWKAATFEVELLRVAHAARSEGILGRMKDVTLGRLCERQRVDRERGLREHIEDCEYEMRCQGVGAPSHGWGVLSGGPQKFSLEAAIRVVLGRVEPSVADELTRIFQMLPQVRVAAELGDPAAVRPIEDALVGAVKSLPEDSAERRHLVEHLPGNLRPVASRIQAIDRPNAASVELSVTYRGPDLSDVQWQKEPGIRLHMIRVGLDLRGLGLGTAALQELLTFADHHQYPIAGVFAPGNREKEYVRGLAVWYYGHGFRVGDKVPERWERGAHMRREPH